MPADVLRQVEPTRPGVSELAHAGTVMVSVTLYA
jgi:hypothetical protein